MKIKTILEQLEILNEMNFSEYKAIQRALLNISNKKFNLGFRFSDHAVKDRFVQGDRVDVTGVDAFKTIKWGFEHPKFNSAVENIKQSDNPQEEQTVRLENVFNKLNIIVVIRKDKIEVVTGDYKGNWEHSKSYRGDMVLKVPMNAWNNPEYAEDRKKSVSNNKRV